MSDPSPDAEHLIRKAVEDPAFDGAIAVDAASEIIAASAGGAFEALRLVAPFAGRFAQVPISGYRVGVATLGRSGRIYLGANMELAGAPLYLAVHSEQCSVGLAKSHGEQALVALAVHAPPCAHCRQFLLELGDPQLLHVITPTRSSPLAELVPDPFTPAALGSDAMALQDSAATLDGSASLLDRAEAAARASHAPYSGSPAGVALELADGFVVTGSYIESVAFNPSLDPTRAACAAAQFRGWPANRIERFVLVFDAGAKLRHDEIARATAAWLPEQPTVEARHVAIA